MMRKGKLFLSCRFITVSRLRWQGSGSFFFRKRVFRNLSFIASYTAQFDRLRIAVQFLWTNPSRWRVAPWHGGSSRCREGTNSIGTNSLPLRRGDQFEATVDHLEEHGERNGIAPVSRLYLLVEVRVYPSSVDGGGIFCERRKHDPTKKVAVIWIWTFVHGIHYTWIPIAAVLAIPSAANHFIGYIVGPVNTGAIRIGLDRKAIDFMEDRSRTGEVCRSSPAGCIHLSQFPGYSWGNFLKK